MGNVNWNDLKSEFLRRSVKVNSEFDLLKEKVSTFLRFEENLTKLNEQHSIFNKNAGTFFSDVFETLTGAADQINDLEIYKLDWTNLNGSDLKRQAIISVKSSIPFKPLGFNLDFVFLNETNPITYRQEFNLTALSFKTSDDTQTTSERNNHTKRLHYIKSLQEWGNLGYATEIKQSMKYVDRVKLIEEELYRVIKDSIVCSTLYSKADFLTYK